MTLSDWRAHFARAHVMHLLPREWLGSHRRGPAPRRPSARVLLTRPISQWSLGYRARLRWVGELRV